MDGQQVRRTIFLACPPVVSTLPVHRVATDCRWGCSQGVIGVSDIAGSPQTPSHSARCRHLREMVVVMRRNSDDEHGAVAIC
jgi:hypothetical protein